MRASHSVKQRQRLPEIMDQPNLDEARHRHALRGLRRLNRWSASAGILWPALRDLARRSVTPLRVLDVATGGGDLPIRLCQLACRAGLVLEMAGCDISATALDHARMEADRAGAVVDFFRCDVLNEALPRNYDVVISSLFLHHLDEEQAVALLRRAAAAADQAVLINDLRRSTPGVCLAWVASRLLTMSPVVHVDAPRSVRAAFTIAEVRELARRAGLHEALVQRKWPLRFLLAWYRSWRPHSD